MAKPPSHQIPGKHLTAVSDPLQLPPFQPVLLLAIVRLGHLVRRQADGLEDLTSPLQLDLV